MLGPVRRLVVPLIVALLPLGLVTVASAPAHAAASGCVAKQWSRGTSGNCVMYLQRMLNGDMSVTYSAGGAPFISTDGSFGPATNTAVRGYQSTYSLKVDGYVGPSTWLSLCRETKGNLTAGNTVYNRIYRQLAYDAGRYAGCSSIYSSY